MFLRGTAKCDVDTEGRDLPTGPTCGAAGRSHTGAAPERALRDGKQSSRHGQWDVGWVDNSLKNLSSTRVDDQVPHEKRMQRRAATQQLVGCWPGQESWSVDQLDQHDGIQGVEGKF